MSRIEYETNKTRIEDVWALLEMMEDSIWRQMQDAIARGNEKQFRELCAQVNLLDRAQEIAKAIRKGRK